MKKKDHIGKARKRQFMVIVSIKFNLRTLKILRGDRKHNRKFR